MSPITSFKGQYAFLSNFAEVGGNSVEHYYQAWKTDDTDTVKRILNAATPAEAKKLGKSVKLRPDWETMKVPVMESLLRWKFNQEPFRTQLLDTGDAELVEGNWWGDTFWGVCKGVGHNMLGKLLMQVRHEIRAAHQSRQHQP